MVRKIGQLFLDCGGGGGGGVRVRWGGGCHPQHPPLSNFRARTVGAILKIFSWTDAPRMAYS